MNLLNRRLLNSSSNSEQYEVYIVTRFALTSIGYTRNLETSFCSGSNNGDGSNHWVYKGNIYYTKSSTEVSPIKFTTGGGVTAIAGNLLEGIFTSASSYFIKNGTLNRQYCSGSSPHFTQISNDTTWRLLTGVKPALAVNANGLYMIDGSTITLISSINTWTKISGTCNIDSTTKYAYGIADGKLYYIYYNGVVQQGSSANWTDITGIRSEGENSTSCRGLGINGGKLYILGDTLQQVGSSSTWSKISGEISDNFPSGYPYYAFGINNGGLYRILGTTATRVGSKSNWVGCSGHSHGPSDDGNRTTCALAYDNSALYRTYSDGTVTKIMDGNFVYCCGSTSRSMTNCAMAIRRVV